MFITTANDAPQARGFFASAKYAGWAAYCKTLASAYLAIISSSTTIIVLRIKEVARRTIWAERSEAFYQRLYDHKGTVAKQPQRAKNPPMSFISQICFSMLHKHVFRFRQF